MVFRRKKKLAAAVPPVVAPPFVEPMPVAPVMQPAPRVSSYSAVTGEPDMRTLGRALWARKKTIVGCTIIAAVAAFVITSAMTPRYRSEARLLLETRENIFMKPDADRASDRTILDAEGVASQTQLLLSRDLARAVVAKEHLNDVAEFGSSGPLRALMGMFGMGRDPNAMTREELTLEAFFERLGVSAVEKSRVIIVEFSSADPELAARVANSIAETYLSMQQNAKQDQTRAAGTWLAGEIDKMRQKVADAEAKVEAYRAQSNLLVGTNNASLPGQQLTEINSQISAARGQKADLEARARQLRDLIRTGQLSDSSDINNSESMRRLIDQRTQLRSQLAEQSTTLMDQHPRIKELRAQIGELDRQLRAEAERLARQFDNDAKVAGDRLDSLGSSLEQVKKTASASNEQDVQLRALDREAKTQRELLESYLVKYREASARESITVAPAEARIISRASAALTPAYPKKMASILIAAFAGFALSSGFVVTGALLNAPAGEGYNVAYNQSPYVQSYPPMMQAPAGMMPPQPMPQQIQPLQFAQQQPRYAPQYAPQPQYAPTEPQTAFSRLPRMASPPLMPSINPLPVQAEAGPLPVSSIEQIAYAMRHGGETGRRVTMIGAARNAGTTYAAITLARALALESNVILVDCAFGAPNLSVISTDPNAPGIAEMARGQVSFGDIITRDQYSTVHIISTGAVGHDAEALAASPLLGSLIEALAQSYDHVVVDIGSVDTFAIERMAPLAHRAVLVASDPAAAVTRAARDRLMMAGYADVALLAGAAQTVVA